jgi:DNA invertase Pin-like site-specific DNA recombinase
VNTGLRGANLFRRPPQGPGLGEALEFVRSGDTFVVTKLDGLARSVPHMREIVQRLQAKGVALRIVTTLDTSPLVMRRTLDFPPRAILSTATW